MGEQNPETGPWKSSLFRIAINFEQLLRFFNKKGFDKIAFKRIMTKRSLRPRLDRKARTAAQEKAGRKLLSASFLQTH